MEYYWHSSEYRTVLEHKQCLAGPVGAVNNRLPQTARSALPQRRSRWQSIDRIALFALFAQRKRERLEFVVPAVEDVPAQPYSVWGSDIARRLDDVTIVGLRTQITRAQSAPCSPTLSQTWEPPCPSSALRLPRILNFGDRRQKEREYSQLRFASRDIDIPPTK